MRNNKAKNITCKIKNTMKKVTKITIVALMFALAFNSCKKYEDGPLISFRSPLNRLLGKWGVEAVSNNGNDITSLYIDSCGCKFSFHSEKHDPKYFALFNCTNGYNYAGSFHFVSNEYIEIFIVSKYNEMGSSNDTVPICGPLKVRVSSRWDVKKLSNKNMWIENNYNGDLYLIKMKKDEKDN